MKNYYELLEVSEKASQEVIKKAYTTLVKKYHPDLQPDSEKKAAEEKIKEINEAYEVLSDSVKRESYDRKLQAEKIKVEQAKYSKTNVQNQTSNMYNNQQNNFSNNSFVNYQKRIIHTPHINNNDYNSDFNNNFQKQYNNIMNEVYQNAYNTAYNNAYNQAYINNLKNMGFDIQYERPFREKIKIAFSTIMGILFFILICFILWHIPFIKNYCVNLYNENQVIKIIVDILNSLITNIFSVFK